MNALLMSYLIKIINYWPTKARKILIHSQVSWFNSYVSMVMSEAQFQLSSEDQLQWTHINYSYVEGLSGKIAAQYHFLIVYYIFFFYYFSWEKNHLHCIRAIQLTGNFQNSFNLNMVSHSFYLFLFSLKIIDFGRQYQ